MTVCEIDVLRTDSGFKQFFRILNTTAADYYDELWIGAEQFQPTPRDGCQVLKSSTAIGLPRAFLSFLDGKDSSAFALVNVPSKWHGRRVKFCLDQTVHKADRGDTIVFEITAFSHPYGPFKSSIDIVIKHSGVGFPRVQSEPSDKIAGYEGRPLAIKITRKGRDGKDNWSAAVQVEGVQLIVAAD